jgi:hypothetical protein
LRECSCEAPEVERMYERPQGRIVSKINAGLGALPEGIEYPDPTMLSAEEGKWSRRLWALITLGLVLAIALTLYNVSPVFSASPSSMLADASARLFGDSWLGVGAYMIVFVALFIVVIKSTAGHKTAPSCYRYKLAERLAVGEELWFRTGCESWSNWRRIFSCFAFGCVHIVNIIYPLSSIVALSVAGGIMMYVYLREYKRSGDAQRATLVATRFHATYNRFALLLLLILVPVVLI